MSSYYLCLCAAQQLPQETRRDRGAKARRADNTAGRSDAFAVAVDGEVGFVTVLRVRHIVVVIAALGTGKFRRVWWGRKGSNSSSSSSSEFRVPRRRRRRRGGEKRLTR